MPRKKNPDITLEAFLASEQEDLAKFKRWWTKMQKETSPDQFPEVMPLGEWWEQYQMFDPNEDI